MKLAKRNRYRKTKPADGLARCKSALWEATLDFVREQQAAHVPLEAAPTQPVTLPGYLPIRTILPRKRGSNRTQYVVLQCHYSDHLVEHATNKDAPFEQWRLLRSAVLPFGLRGIATAGNTQLLLLP